MPGHVDILDQWVDHPHGRIFSRTWIPGGEPEGAGRPSPIVLFHDSLGCVALWREFPLQLSLATGRRVVAYDRLGFGQSDARCERPALDFIAEEATLYFPAVHRQLGLERFIAYGHSVGGAMAIHCAAAFASRCEALITEAAQVFAEDRTLQGIRAAKCRFDDGQIERLVKYHGGKARWILDAWTEVWLDPRFASWTLSDVLPLVSCPVLALHGEFDEYGSMCHPNWISQRCSGRSRVEILADTAHVPHGERLQQVVDLVSAFLR